MEYECTSCEVSFEITFTSEAKDSYADISYCPNCGKATLADSTSIEELDSFVVMRIGQCDICCNKNRNLTKGEDSFGVHVIDYCAYGCNDERSVFTLDEST